MGLVGVERWGRQIRWLIRARAHGRRGRAWVSLLVSPLRTIWGAGEVKPEPEECTVLEAALQPQRASLGARKHRRAGGNGWWSGLGSGRARESIWLLKMHSRVIRMEFWSKWQRRICQEFIWRPFRFRAFNLPSYWQKGIWSIHVSSQPPP